MKDILKKLERIAANAQTSSTRSVATCSGCCRGGSCCSNPISG